MRDHKKTNGDLDHLLRQSIASISWRDQMMAGHALGKAATHQDRLAVAMVMRDGGALSEDAAFFYVALWIMQIAEDRICDPHRPDLHPELEPIRAGIEWEASRRAQGRCLRVPDEVLPARAGCAPDDRQFDTPGVQCLCCDRKSGRAD